MFMILLDLLKRHIGGITMYTAVAKLDMFCKEGDWVVILGAGGGLGHLYVLSNLQLHEEQIFTMICYVIQVHTN